MSEDKYPQVGQRVRLTGPAGAPWIGREGVVRTSGRISTESMEPGSAWLLLVTLDEPIHIAGRLRDHVPVTPNHVEVIQP